MSEEPGPSFPIRAFIPKKLAIIFLLLFLCGVIRTAQLHSGDCSVFTVRPDASDNSSAQFETGCFSFLDGVVYRSTAVVENGIEAVHFKADPQGILFETDRQVHDRAGNRLSETRIRIQQDLILVTAKENQSESSKKIEIPQGHLPMVGPGVLVWLRVNDLPVDEDRAVYLVDFDGHAIRAKMRNEGVEEVTVPAGRFRCRRIGVILGVPLIHPRMDFWITDDDERKLVKHRGRRGFLSKTFISELQSFQGGAPADRMVENGNVAAKSIYDLTLADIDGKSVLLSLYKGKVMLIVNVASKCGFTPQYKGLQDLFTKYKDKGLVVLGFPANNFLWQEPGTDEEIKSFCSLKYQVTFPMFSKISVKGKDKHPLYKYLTEKSTNPEYAGEISWNFNKFLIDRSGKVVARFGSKEKPESVELISGIEKALSR